MSEETRQRIIEAGAELIHLQGFSATGLKEILDLAGVPKGSFYHYFKSKEAFGLAVVEHFAARFGVLFKNIAEDESLSPLTRLNTFLAAVEERFEQEGCRKGCPIGNLAQEMGGLSDPFRMHLQQVIDRMAEGFASLIRMGQKQGEARTDLDPLETAYFMISGWHGALIRMKVIRSTEPIKLCHRFFDEMLRVR
jgi:TetR/AcrR family transcriptional repressor of nem operon